MFLQSRQEPHHFDGAESRADAALALILVLNMEKLKINLNSNIDFQ
jgi:hypothetical protein